MKMTDNLVKRLRDGCVTGNYEGLEFIEWSKSNATMNEAADRIEALWTVFQETTNKWHDALDRIEALEAVLREAHELMHNLTAIIPHNDMAYNKTTNLMTDIRDVLGNEYDRS
jgi:hypothetical protein